MSRDQTHKEEVWFYQNFLLFQIYYVFVYLMFVFIYVLYLIQYVFKDMYLISHSDDHWFTRHCISCAKNPLFHHIGRVPHYIFSLHQVHRNGGIRPKLCSACTVPSKKTTTTTIWDSITEKSSLPIGNYCLCENIYVIYSYILEKKVYYKWQAFIQDPFLTSGEAFRKHVLIDKTMAKTLSLKA